MCRADEPLLRPRHIEHDVCGAEAIGTAGGIARAFDVAIGDDALDPAVGIQEKVKLIGRRSGFAAFVG